jgi:hypothetical protein
VAEFGGNGDSVDSAGFGQDAAGFVRLVCLAQEVGGQGSSPAGTPYR